MAKNFANCYNAPTAATLREQWENLILIFCALIIEKFAMKTMREETTRMTFGWNDENSSKKSRFFTAAKEYCILLLSKENVEIHHNISSETFGRKNEAVKNVHRI